MGFIRLVLYRNVGEPANGGVDMAGSAIRLAPSLANKEYAVSRPNEVIQRAEILASPWDLRTVKEDRMK